METKTKEVMVTPEMAMEILKTNIRNRPMQAENVMFFVDQIEKGQFAFNGQPVIISKNNLLMDGQHRLAAIVKSKKSQKLLIVYGIEEDVMHTIDTGKKRSAADVLKINGVSNAGGIAAVITAYQRTKEYKTYGSSNKRLMLTRKDVIEIYNANVELLHDIAPFAAKCNKKVRLIDKSVLGGYICYLLLDKKHEYEKVISFFEQLHTGYGVENETILTLRNKLLQNATSVSKLPFRTIEQYIIIAWNAYAKGKEVKALRISLDSPQEFI
jgi:hypothetical protein